MLSAKQRRDLENLGMRMEADRESIWEGDGCLDEFWFDAELDKAVTLEITAPELEKLSGSRMWSLPRENGRAERITGSEGFGCDGGVKYVFRLLYWEALEIAMYAAGETLRIIEEEPGGTGGAGPAAGRPGMREGRLRPYAAKRLAPGGISKRGKRSSRLTADRKRPGRLKGDR